MSTGRGFGGDGDPAIRSLRQVYRSELLPKQLRSWQDLQSSVRILGTRRLNASSGIDEDGYAWHAVCKSISFGRVNSEVTIRLHGIFDHSVRGYSTAKEQLEAAAGQYESSLSPFGWRKFWHALGAATQAYVITIGGNEAQRVVLPAPELALDVIQAQLAEDELLGRNVFETEEYFRRQVDHALQQHEVARSAVNDVILPSYRAEGYRPRLG